MRSIVFAIALLLGFGAVYETVALAQEPPDAPNRFSHDDLLENLTGKWRLTRSV
jgi:hypothetical protein